MDKSQRTHVHVPVALMQEIVNYLLECKAKETIGMLLELKKLEEPNLEAPVTASEK
jgi:hypothetical protein